MANNRLWLRTLDGTKNILLAKYYPSTGWYLSSTEKELNRFLEFLGDGSMFGPTNLQLIYESLEPDDTDMTKQNVLEILQEEVDS